MYREKGAVQRGVRDRLGNGVVQRRGMDGACES